MRAFSERLHERITERVVTHSLGEWKGRGMEEEWSKNRVAASSISSGSVPRAARLAMDGQS